MAENLNTAPAQTLADGGLFVAMQKSGANVSLRTIAVSSVKAGVDLAATALQPGSVADMAYEDPADWVPRSEYDVTVSDLVAATAALQVQVTQLLELVGVGNIAVYDTNVYEPGVYA